MGTHPIFESDFDCLTENKKKMKEEYDERSNGRDSQTKIGGETLVGFIGFANLPNQVHRKSVKKGFEFTLMVVGESGLGKSTLINALFLTNLYPDRELPDAEAKIKQTVQIESSTVEIEERGVRLRLTPLTTVNATNQFSIILMPNLNNICMMNQDLIEETFQIIEFTVVSISSLHTDMVSSHWILNI